MADSIWVVSYNHDYTEWSRAFPDPCLAVIDIARELDCTPGLSEGATAEFWKQVDLAYEAGKWKGLSVHEIDLGTLEATKRGPDDLLFTLSRLAEVDGDFSDDPDPSP